MSCKYEKQLRKDLRSLVIDTMAGNPTYGTLSSIRAQYANIDLNTALYAQAGDIDRMGAKIFVTNSGHTLRWIDCEWCAIDAPVDFACDEDTEHPIYADGTFVRGSFLRLEKS